MMIDCEKAGALIDQKEFEKLGWMARRKLKLHLKMCALCKKYEDDNKVMGKILKMAGIKYSSNCISDSEKDQMKEKLANQ